MTNAYLYSDFAANGDRATPKNNEFHAANHALNRLNTFIIKKADAPLEDENEDTTTSFTVSIEYPTDIRLKRNDSLLSYTTSNGKRLSSLADIEHNSSLALSITDSATRQYVLQVDGQCTYSIVGKTIRIINIRSDISVKLRIRTNENYTVILSCADASHLESFSLGPEEYYPSSGVLNKTVELSKDEYSQISFDCLAAEGYTVDNIQVFSNAQYSNDITEQVKTISGGTSMFRFSDSIATYYVVITLREVYTESYEVIVNIDHPEKINYFSIQYGDTITAPDLSRYSFSVASHRTKCQFILYANNNELSEVTLDGVGQETINDHYVSISVNFSPNKRGAENPYVINIMTKAEAYKVTIEGAEHATLTYKNNSMPAYAPCEQTAIGSDLVSYAVCGDNRAVHIHIVAKDGYSLNGTPYVTHGTATTDYTLNYFTIIASSDVTIFVPIISDGDISDDNEWQNAEIAFRGSYWNSLMEYSITFQISSQIMYSFGIKLTPNTSYRFKFTSNSVIPAEICYRTSNKLLSSSERAAEATGYTVKAISIDSDGYMVLSYDEINTGYSYLYVAFHNFTNYPTYKNMILSAIEYRAEFVEDLAPDTDVPAYFGEGDILKLSVIDEVDVTASQVPYSACSFTIKDENDVYNPAIRGAQGNLLEQNQRFEVYSIVSEVPDIFSNSLVSPAKYINKVGTFRLKDIAQDNLTANFEMIGTLEYYDEKELSENEKILSSTLKKTSVISYLRALFGADVDTSAFRAGQMIITPFETESKTEIARIIAEYFSMYLYETVDGRIAFKKLADRTYATNNSQPFKLNLGRQRRNPEISKINEATDSVSVDITRYTPGGIIQLDMMNECDVEVYVKRTTTVANNPLLDSAENLDGYDLIAIMSEGIFKFYGEDGTEIDEINIGNNLQSIQNPKYLMFKINLPSNCSVDDFCAFRSDASLNFDDILSTYCMTNAADATDRDKIGGALTEKAAYFWCTFTPNGTFNDVINGIDVPYYSSFFDFFFNNSVVLTELLKKVECAEIVSDTVSYIYSPFKTRKNTYEVSNPLVSSKSAAERVAMYMYAMKNRQIYRSESDWRGDCSVRCGDEILSAVCIGRGTAKTFENYYSGTVVYNEITYEGNLRQKTATEFEEQYLYARDGNGATSPKIGQSLPLNL